jgi:hypothetical protein
MVFFRRTMHTIATLYPKRFHIHGRVFATTAWVHKYASTYRALCSVKSTNGCSASPTPPLDSLSTLQASHDLLNLLRSQSRSPAKPQSLSPSQRFEPTSSVQRLLKSCVFDEGGASAKDPYPSRFLDDQFLSKIDPKVLFELGNPIVKNVTLPPDLLTEPYAIWITSGCFPPSLCRTVHDEFMTSGERYHIKFLDWVEVRRHEILTNHPFLYSYFGSNGIAPTNAKEKDVLSRLFEKYRGGCTNRS